MMPETLTRERRTSNEGQVIGKTMPHGYAGSYSRQADMIVDTHPCEAGIAFGAPVVLGTTGAVKAWEAASTAAKFVGVAVREVKSAFDYMNQNVGSYRTGDAVPVLKRGCVNVICQNGTPVAGGKVYVRTVKNESYRMLQLVVLKQQRTPERMWN